VDAVRAKPSRYLPTVLTKAEALAVIEQISGTYQLVVKLLYGSGLQLREGLQLRVKDVDFAQRQIVVRDTKGKESRITMLPDRLMNSLKKHLQQVHRSHQRDLDAGYGSVYLPFALERKYPNADRAWIWQFVFRLWGCLKIRAVVWCVVTTCMKQEYRKLLSRRFRRLVLKNE
jgi:integrase